MSRLTGVGLALLLAMGTAACGQGVAATEVGDQLRQLVDRPTVLDEAENRLTAQCMNGAGLDYPPVPTPHDDRPMAGLLRGEPPLTVDEVRAHGYPDRWLNPAPPPPAEGPVEKYANSLPADARARFFHVLTGEGGNDVKVTLPGDFHVAASSEGCVGSARRQLYGSVANFLTVYYLPELAQRQAAAAEQDPDVHAVYTAFAQCMAAKGYQTATPAEAVTLAKTYYPDGRREQADDKEKALAVADAECEAAVHLYDRHAAAVDRVVRSWLAVNETAVAEAYAALQAALAEANKTMH